MITAYRFNFSRLPKEVKMCGDFDHERCSIYRQILSLVDSFEMSSKTNWFPLNTLLSKFKAVYGLAIAERQEICTILIARILGGKITSQVALQQAMSLVCLLIQNKQKYFSGSFAIDWK